MQFRKAVVQGQRFLNDKNLVVEEQREMGDVDKVLLFDNDF